MHRSSDTITPAGESTPDRRLFDVPEVAKLLSVSERYVWTLIARWDRGAEDGLESIKLGKTRKVPSECLDAFVTYLRGQAEAAREAAA